MNDAFEFVSSPIINLILISKAFLAFILAIYESVDQLFSLTSNCPQF